MIKKIIVSIGLLFSLVSFAQEGTSSPYSFYGIGDIRFKGTTETRSMGGFSSIPDSIHLNLQNPAMYASLKLTSFSLGGTFASNRLKTNDQNEKAQRTTLDYLAVGLPLKKLGIGFGLIPYSSVGYNVKNTEVISNITTDKRYVGKGGINKVYFGFGYQLFKNFSIGADAQYNFGKIETKSIATPYNPDNTPVQYSTREINTSNASGLNFNTGISYQAKLTNKIGLFTSATYSPEAILNLTNTRTLAIIQYVVVGQEAVNGEAVDINVANTKLKLPSKFSFGLGIGEAKKWIIGTEIMFQNTSSFGNRFNDITKVTYENSTKYTIGGYYIPNYKSFDSFFKKVVYRGGFRYENTGLIINDQSIKDAALTLGMGMPLRGTFSNVNLGLEFGSRGTKNAGLVKEQYFNFSLGLSLNDEWFVKRKFN